MPESPNLSTVNNHDILHIDALIRRFQDEMVKSVSSGTSGFNEFDQARLEDYLKKAALYLAYATDQPQLDLPESQPAGFVLEPAIVFPDVENESINTLLRLFSALRLELLNSQSARDGSGLQSHDKKRADALIDKMQNFLNQYIRVTQPTDLPESSPQTPSSGAGRTGT